MARGGRREGAGRPRERDPGEYRSRTLELHQRHDSWLRAEAQRRGCSVSALVRELVDEAAAEVVPEGSVKNGCETAYLHRATPEGLVELGELGDWRRQFLSIRDLIAARLRGEG